MDMLKIDLKHLTHEQLADAVSLYCAEIGGVKSVVILQPEAGARRAFALITMASQAELDRVVNLLGDGQVGTMAVVRLEHEALPVPSFLLRGAAGPNLASV
jgi:hypothetical protein